MKIITENKQFWYGSFLIFFLDQMTKIWALNYLPYNESKVLNSFISLTRIYNENTVLLNHSFDIPDSTFRLLWIFFAGLLSFFIAWVLRQDILKNGKWQSEFVKTGLFCIIGSIWGNAFDRSFRSQGVVDFIHLTFSYRTQPVMNVADIMIYVGEICLLISLGLAFYESIQAKNTPPK